MLNLLMMLVSVAPPWIPPTPAEIAQAETLVSGLAVATAPAVRTGNTVQETPTLPPPPPAPTFPTFTSDSYNGRCTGAEGLLAFFSPGWNVTRMAGIAYRESRCDPGASNSCCSGLLQIHKMHIPRLGHCG